MTKTPVTDWNPEQDLIILLDALTEEILTAADRDFTVRVRETGGEPQAAAETVRRLIASADAGLIVPPASDVIARGLRVHLARTQ